MRLAATMWFSTVVKGLQNLTDQGGLTTFNPLWIAYRIVSKCNLIECVDLHDASNSLGVPNRVKTI